jgi:hypothetical protein
MREHHRPDMSEEEATALLHQCLKVGGGQLGRQRGRAVCCVMLCCVGPRRRAVCVMLCVYGGLMADFLGSGWVQGRGGWVALAAAAFTQTPVGLCSKGNTTHTF